MIDKLTSLKLRTDHLEETSSREQKDKLQTSRKYFQ